MQRKREDAVVERIDIGRKEESMNGSLRKG